MSSVRSGGWGHQRCSPQSGQSSGSPQWFQRVLWLKVGAASIRPCWQSHWKWYFHCASCFSAPFCLLVVPWGLSSSGQRQKVPLQSGPVCSEWSISPSFLDPSNHWLPWWGHHQTFLETDPGGQSWRPGQTWHWLPHRGTSGKDFDLGRAELRRHGGAGRCWTNPDSGWPKTVAPSPPLSQKPKAYVLILKLIPLALYWERT